MLPIIILPQFTRIICCARLANILTKLDGKARAVPSYLPASLLSQPYAEEIGDRRRCGFSVVVNHDARSQVKRARRQFRLLSRLLPLYWWRQGATGQFRDRWRREISLNAPCWPIVDIRSSLSKCGQAKSLPAVFRDNCLKKHIMIIFIRVSLFFLLRLLVSVYLPLLFCFLRSRWFASFLVAPAQV